MRHLGSSALRRLAVPPALAVLAAGLALWGSWFIWRTSYTAQGARTFCLFDDAMISMAYGRNLVAGHGLNWARYGEPVEGFSHPLWTFLMAGVHLLPVGPQRTSLLIQLLSLACLVANVVAVRWLTLRHFSTPRARSWLPAAALTAFYYPLNHWALQGMETGLQALLTTLAVGLALDLVCRGERRHLALFAVLAVAYLLRMDMALLAVVVLAWVGAHGGFRRAHRREWLQGIALLAAAVLGYQLFRWIVFRDVLPNTYYLKLTGVPLEVRWLKGLATLSDFLRPILIPMAAVGLGVAALRRSRRQLALPALIVAAYLAYSVYVGGDVWEKAQIGANRFVAFVMPLVFVLANGLVNEGLEALARSRTTHLLPASLAALAQGAVGLVLVLVFNGLWPQGSAESWSRLLVLDPPLHARQHERFTREILALQSSGLVAADARVAVIWAGIPAYFSTWQMVDVMGYNDRFIARQPASVPLTPGGFRYYQPGHLKARHEYALRVHQPDLLYQFWGLAPEKQAALLERYGYEERQGLWFRRGSPKIDLDRWVRFRRTLGRESGEDLDRPPPKPPPAAAGPALDPASGGN